jgi:hypothetical protein
MAVIISLVRAARGLSALCPDMERAEKISRLLSMFPTRIVSSFAGSKIVRKEDIQRPVWLLWLITKLGFSEVRGEMPGPSIAASFLTSHTRRWLSLDVETMREPWCEKNADVVVRPDVLVSRDTSFTVAEVEDLDEEEAEEEEEDDDEL